MIFTDPSPIAIRGGISMSKNYRVSAMLNTEEYELLEDLKKYYSTNTSNILKSGLALLNNTKPPLLISQTVSKVDKTNIIFNKILNLQKIDGRKINIFTNTRIPQILWK